MQEWERRGALQRMGAIAVAFSRANIDQSWPRREEHYEMKTGLYCMSR